MQILKNNLSEYSWDLKHARLVLNWRIGISSDIAKENYNLSRKARFSYF